MFFLCPSYKPQSILLRRNTYSPFCLYCLELMLLVAHTMEAWIAVRVLYNTYIYIKYYINIKIKYSIYIIYFIYIKNIWLASCLPLCASKISTRQSSPQKPPCKLGLFPKKGLALISADICSPAYDPGSAWGHSAGHCPLREQQPHYTSSVPGRNKTIHITLYKKNPSAHPNLPCQPFVSLT